MSRPILRWTDWVFACIALAWRLLLAAWTPVPAEDGVNYLWMAERFAAGDASAALSEVFPPLYPLLLVPAVWLGADPFRSAQIVVAVVGAACVLLGAATVRSAWPDRPGIAHLAALLIASSPLHARLGAELYSEPLFVLLVFGALLAFFRQRSWWIGLGVGAAFWVRPEALALWFGLGWAACTAPEQRAARIRDFARVSLGVGGAVLGLAIWRAALGHGFELLPKVAFNASKSVFGADSWGEGVVRVVVACARLPWLAVEALGAVAVLAAVGLVASRRNPLGRIPGQRVWVATAVVAAGAIALFVPRRRFVAAWLPLAVLWAVVGWTVLQSLVLRSRPFQRRRSPPDRAESGSPGLGSAGPGPLRRGLGAAAVVGIVVWHLAVGARVTHPNRAAERQLGEFLGGRLTSTERVTGDLTRVLYFAGQRPLPPRHFSADELIAAAQPASVRYVVLGTHRPTTPLVRSALTGFVPLELPAGLDKSVDARGITVLARRPRAEPK